MTITTHPLPFEIKTEEHETENLEDETENDFEEDSNFIKFENNTDSDILDEDGNPQENISADSFTVEKVFICHYCEKSFKRECLLVQHMEFHKDPTEWKFECLVCRKKCATKQILKRHAAVHSNVSHFQCEHCGKRFKSDDHLKRHLIYQRKRQNETHVF